MITRIIDWVAMYRVFLIGPPLVMALPETFETLFEWIGIRLLVIQGFDATSILLGPVVGGFVGWGFARIHGRRYVSSRFGVMPRHWFTSSYTEQNHWAELFSEMERVEQWCEKHKVPYVYHRTSPRFSEDKWPTISYGFRTAEQAVHCRLSI